MKSQTAKSSWPLLGNGHVFEFLRKSLAKKNAAGAYIFSGPEGIGKTAAANFFARGLVCLKPSADGLPCGQCPACLEAVKGTHGDIYLLAKEEGKKNIAVDQVREFIRCLGLSSFLNSYKIGVIKGAESLSEGAVNALLKTLEEPKSKVVIILTVSDFRVLPLTIISRAQILRFRPVAAGEIYDELVKERGASRSQAKDLSRLAAGRPALALKFLEDRDYYENYRVKVEAFSGLTSADLNDRFAAIESGLGKGGAEAALELIAVWKNLARDLTLLELNLPELIQHEAFLKELTAAGGRFSLKILLDLTAALEQARRYVAANVNPKLALETAAVSW